MYGLKIILNWRGGRHKVTVDLISICTILGQQAKSIKFEVCHHYLTGWKLQTGKRMKSRGTKPSTALASCWISRHHTTETIKITWWQRIGLKLDIAQIYILVCTV